MKKMIATFIRNEEAAAAAEYALLLAIVAAGIAIAAFNLGSTIKTSMETSQACIQDPTAEGCGAATPTQ